MGSVPPTSYDVPAPPPSPAAPTPRKGTPLSAEVSVESVFPRLEALLPLVTKPVQYVGGELNAVTKPWDSVSVHWALMYPDAYEVGLPNQGVMILYEVLNEQPGVLAERTYSVWPDLEALMREHDVPQFTVDAHRPVGAFDVFGISFSTELGYTNMLGALDLSISAIISVSAGMVVHYGGEGSSTPLVLAAALVVPVLISLVNGVLIAVLRLNALIVTLATVAPAGAAGYEGVVAWSGELGYGVQPRREFFPIRNRIISGLSAGLLVVEGDGAVSYANEAYLKLAGARLNHEIGVPAGR